jgi:hypothetical protein
VDPDPFRVTGAEEAPVEPPALVELLLLDPQAAMEVAMTPAAAIESHLRDMN